MRVLRKELAAAYDVVARVPAEAGLVCSQLVRLQAGSKLSLCLSGVAVACSTCKVFKERDEQESWVGCVDRRLLGAFLNVAADEHVDLVWKKGQLQLRSGYHRVRLSLVEGVVGYGEWKGGGQEIDIRGWSNELPLLASYAGAMAGMERYAAVFFLPKWGVVATDGLALAACLDTNVSVSLALPTLIAGAIASKDERCVVDKQGVALRFGVGYLYQTQVAQLEKSPTSQMQKLVDEVRYQPPGFVIHAEDLAAVLAQLGRFTSGGSLIRYEGLSAALVRFSSEAEGVRVEQASAARVKITGCEGGWASERVRSWVQMVTKAKADAWISCGCAPEKSVHWLRAKVNKRHCILTVLDVSVV